MLVISEHLVLLLIFEEIVLSQILFFSVVIFWVIVMVGLNTKDMHGSIVLYCYIR